MSAFRVGLTGGLAGGKSTLAGWMREAGFRVIDADELVAELYRPGGEGAAAVAALFGPGALDSKGGVDHGAVAARVFADPQARRALERVIHPLVRRRFAAIAERGGGVVVLEATLLVEAGYAPDFDLVVTVEADPETRLRRATGRGLDPAGARARLAAQGDGVQRRAAAHRVVVNDGDLSDFRRQADALIAEVRRLSSRNRPDPRPGA
jgi:dephospho-CoA kinase